MGETDCHHENIEASAEFYEYGNPYWQIDGTAKCEDCGAEWWVDYSFDVTDGQHGSQSEEGRTLYDCDECGMEKFDSDIVIIDEEDDWMTFCSPECHAKYRCPECGKGADDPDCCKNEEE